MAEQSHIYSIYLVFPWIGKCGKPWHLDIMVRHGLCMSCLLKSITCFLTFWTFKPVQPSESEFYRDGKRDPCCACCACYQCTYMHILCQQISKRLSCSMSNASHVGPRSSHPHISVAHATPRSRPHFRTAPLAFLCVRNFRSSKLCCLRSSSEIHKPWCVSSSDFGQETAGW